MKLAFVLFEYFPFGGLQRDCYRIAAACAEAGAQVTIFCREWEGEEPKGVTVVRLGTSGRTNASREKHFVKAFSEKIKTLSFDRIIGFNKMPGLDLYFAADPCYVARAQKKYPWFYRWTAHYRTYAAFEEAVFGTNTHTRILLINPQEKNVFQSIYQTPDSRFHLLPPGINPDRCAPIDYLSKRNELREQHDLTENDKVILFIASAFKTKGLDRVLQTMAQLPEDMKAVTQLWVVGNGDPKPYESQIQKLKLDKIHFLGGRHDIPDLLWLADVLFHPAYMENTGTVLIEAAVAGLPVLTTKTCGYSGYIREKRAGIVLKEPFNLVECVAALEGMLNQPEPYRSNGIAFGLNADIYSMVEQAQNFIEMPLEK